MAQQKAAFGHENIPLTKDFVLADRASYLGGNRTSAVQKLDEKFGSGNWTIGYILDGKAISRDEALQLYERSYEAFLRDNPAITERLVREARDIYDTAPSNVESGLDYHRQEDTRSHLQDIAIRRALKNMGLSFQGETLMQVRDVGSDFPELSPGKLPFVLPKSSINPRRAYVADWVQPGSVEDFWQNNKYVFAKNEGRVVERLRAQVDQRLRDGEKEARTEIEDTLLSLITMGASVRDLTERYLTFLNEKDLQRFAPEGRNFTVPIVPRFLGLAEYALPPAITSGGWGTKEVVTAIDSLRPLFTTFGREDDALGFSVGYPQHVEPLLKPAILCGYLHYVEHGQWATRGNVYLIFSLPGILERVEADPHYRNFIKGAPIVRKGVEEITSIVLKPGLRPEYRERGQRFISLLLDLKKETEQ